MRKLQIGDGLLSDAAADAYLDSIEEVVENGVSAGTTVRSVTLASLTEVNDSLRFVAAIILEVSCDSDPCDQAEAESDALGQVDSSIETSLSDGSLDDALATNLMGVDDCGTAFDSCTDFQESAAMATATTEVFQREYILYYMIYDPLPFVYHSALT